MPSESSFEQFRSNYERVSVRRQILEAQINIVELYNERMLSEGEAETVTAALAKAKDQRDLEIIKEKMGRWGVTDLQRLENSEQNEIAVQSSRDSFQEKAALLNSENWKFLLAEFISQIELRHPSVFQEILVKGWISRLLEQAYGLSRRASLGALSFSDEVASVMENAGRLPDFLAADNRVIGGKRQPSFLESVEATLERFAVIEQLPAAFGGAVEGIIVGGSLSYGPFYNVRKNMDATGSSDIDIICTLSAQRGTSAWVSLSHTNLIPAPDSERFIQRAGMFDELHGRGEADIISQRFQVVNKDFTVSAHFFPIDFFSEMSDGRLGADLSSNQDVVCLVRDYKARRFEHPACVQQSFDGEEYVYVVPNQLETEKGVITTLPSYIIAGGRFYPGLYQNLISPEFSVFHDATGATDEAVRAFQDLMLQRAQQEKSARPNSAITRSHIRNLVFAPERYTD